MFLMQLRTAYRGTCTQLGAGRVLEHLSPPCVATFPLHQSSFSSSLSHSLSSVLSPPRTPLPHHSSPYLRLPQWLAVLFDRQSTVSAVLPLDPAGAPVFDSFPRPGHVFGRSTKKVCLLALSRDRKRWGKQIECGLLILVACGRFRSYATITCTRSPPKPPNSAPTFLLTHNSHISKNAWDSNIIKVRPSRSERGVRVAMLTKSFR
jgi:hypothetical protein